MKFIRIDPKKRRIDLIEAEGFMQAVEMCGLKMGEVDHGSLSPCMNIVVYEYGLFEAENSYFTLGMNLYAGPALIYRSDRRGETIDVFDDDLRNLGGLLAWVPNREAVNRGIKAGVIIEPQVSVDGEVTWKYGQPPPPSLPFTPQNQESP